MAAKRKRSAKKKELELSTVKINYKDIYRRTGYIAFALLGIFLLLGLLEYQNSYPNFVERTQSLLFFTFMCVGLGYGLIKATRAEENIESRLEYFIMLIGLGLSVFPILIVILTAFRIPLDWRVFLVLSAIFPLKAIISYRNRIKEETGKFIHELKTQDLYLALAILVASILFIIYVKAAFQNPYFEDGDTWAHAAGIKYVSVMHTYVRPPGLNVGSYLEPYPPALDTLMGVVKQLNTSVYWTGKFFMQVLVALGVVFCFFFVKELSGSPKLAFFSAFFLAITPPYLSHILWSHAYSIIQFFPLFYFIEKARKNSSWSGCATVALAGSLLIQPLFSLVNGIMYLIYLAVAVLHDRKLLKRLFAIGAAGLILAMVYWIPELTTPKDKEVERIHLSQIKTFQWHFGAEESERLYGLSDFINVNPSGDIFTHQGLGLAYVIMILTVIALSIKDYRDKILSRPWFSLILAWSAFLFIALQSWVLPISVFPSRFWGMLPLTVPILAAEGFICIEGLLKKDVVIKYAALGVLLAGMLYGSAYPRYVVQTANWPPGIQWNTQEELSGYISMRTQLPPDTKVYAYCMADYSTLGFDMLDYSWDYEVDAFRKRMADPVSVHELYAFLKSKQYEYLVMDSGCYVRCNEYNMTMGKNAEACMANIQNLINETANSQNFAVATANRGFVLFKVN